ncbi:hypothetical protein [Nitratireductor sp. GCM10026969]|uniref:hypothetical protein n=1 Tax=Nitratireductor sp. GCM10026969 TaxID=3252645 RepID=UPI003618E3AA
MKRIVALAAASLLASSAFSFAQQNGDNGLSGDGLGANGFDAGDVQSEALGQGEDNEQLGVRDDETRIDEGTTAAVGDEQFDRTMFLMGERDFDLSSVEPDADVRVISLANMSQENRQELEAAIAANEQSITELRTALSNRGIQELEQSVIDNTVAAEVNARNELVVYVR